MIHRTQRTMLKYYLIAMAATMTASAAAEYDPIVLDNFDEGVTYLAGTPNPMPNNTWLAVKDDPGYETKAELTTSNGDNVLRIYKDTEIHERGNGIYTILPNAIPTDGTYRVRCTMKFLEKQTAFNQYQAQSYFIIGVIVNGVHRNATGIIASPTIYGHIPNGHLTSGDDSALPPITIETPVFSANAGDDLQIIFSTWITYNKSSALVWQDSAVLIDNIELLPITLMPVSLSAWTLE